MTRSDLTRAAWARDPERRSKHAAALRAIWGERLAGPMLEGRRTAYAERWRELDAPLRALLAQGVSLSATARKLGVATAAVAARADRLGIPRPRWNRK